MDQTPEAVLARLNAPIERRRAMLLWLARLLLGIAAAVAAYLFISALKAGSIVGCGSEGGCNEVLQSRWSKWWYVPVAGPAFAAYGAMICLTFLSSTRWQRTAMAALGCAILGTASWFVFLQIIVLHHFCPYCIAAHLCGAGAALLLLRKWIRAPREGFILGIVALLVLILGQIYLRTSTVTWDTSGGPDFQIVRGEHPEILFYKGKVRLDLHQVPILGSPDAPHLVVLLFDVNCPHCRNLHSQLEAVRARNGGKLAIVALPMPLDSTCNQEIPAAGMKRRNPCRLARLALAVWRANPGKFAGFVDYLFDPYLEPGADVAEGHAADMVGAAELAKALKDPWVDQQLKTDIQLYASNAKYSRNWMMPQMMMGKTFMRGTPDYAELDRKMDAYLKE